MPRALSSRSVTSSECALLHRQPSGLYSVSIGHAVFETASTLELCGVFTRGRHSIAYQVNEKQAVPFVMIVTVCIVATSALQIAGFVNRRATIDSSL